MIQNDYLTQAAILLFAENPEKYITGAYIKIGFFESDSELRFQDEIHGSLIEQVDKTMEIWLEELKNLITFDMWYFGHYHDDRLVRPGVQMLYKIGDPIENAKARWIDKDPEYLIGWAKDPNYYT